MKCPICASDKGVILKQAEQWTQDTEQPEHWELTTTLTCLSCDHGIRQLWLVSRVQIDASVANPQIDARRTVATMMVQQWLDPLLPG